MDDAQGPLFEQIARLIVDAIVAGSLNPGDRAPSQNELARFHNVNPATARKGLSILVERNILHKRRGLGMFVTDDAKQLILADRTRDFAADYVAPLVREARALNISGTHLHDLIDQALLDQVDRADTPSGPDALPGR
ncbi:GntR family transcriptional regulator [Corynebacterium mendelii]|uniref:GntR family transcriptional regulator n=1 Tax=Corynebacterium mendelii TaxID=2765362 RepID=A0A939E0V4_9CORY|nr:GntR family transcriptional regulator [Corynebacterium mendelii]MBN9644369.1 GntR family transcriptional regulator [Corynebacterium mendelii]